MKYKSDAGPKIKVDFTIANGVISNIHLSNTNKNGTSWEVLSDQPCSDLERAIGRWMDDYCHGRPPKESLPFDLESFPSFTKKVLLYLATLPYGSTMSYKELAATLHAPEAARAVGNACGRNPLPLLIPCHRILAKSHRLGGFSGGLSIKEKLLQHEKIAFIK